MQTPIKLSGNENGNDVKIPFITQTPHEVKSDKEIKDDCSRCAYFCDVICICNKKKSPFVAPDDTAFNLMDFLQ